MSVENRVFYDQYVCIDVIKSKQTCLETMPQANTAWHQQCQLRITASRAYSLYTYLKNVNADWRKKLLKIVKPSKISTPAMRYGTSARRFYEKKKKSASRSAWFDCKSYRSLVRILSGRVRPRYKYDN